MKGPLRGGTAAGGSGKGQEGSVAPELQAGGRVETAGLVGSIEGSGWSEPDWNLGTTALVKVWGTPGHDLSRWCLHPGDQTRLEVAARP